MTLFLRTEGVLVSLGEHEVLPEIEAPYVVDTISTPNQPDATAHVLDLTGLSMQEDDLLGLFVATNGSAPGYVFTGSDPMLEESGNFGWGGILRANGAFFRVGSTLPTSVACTFTDGPRTSELVAVVIRKGGSVTGVGGISYGSTSRDCDLYGGSSGWNAPAYSLTIMHAATWGVMEVPNYKSPHPFGDALLFPPDVPSIDGATSMVVCTQNQNPVISAGGYAGLGEMNLGNYSQCGRIGVHIDRTTGPDKYYRSTSVTFVIAPEEA